MKGAPNAISSLPAAASFAMDKLLSDPLTISVCAHNADFCIIVSRPLNEAEKARGMALTKER